MRLINNALWFARNRLGSRARVVYDSIHDLDRLAPTFDVVTVSSVLLHVRDLFQALAQAAARSYGRIVVTDIAQEHFRGHAASETDEFCMHFIPRQADNSPVDTWWFVPEKLTEEFLRILGFRDIRLTCHRQRFMPDHQYHFYTLVRHLADLR